MFDCAAEVLGHHDDEATLRQEERDHMRERRDANRERLKSGLKDADNPAPREFKSQGSYVMKTMTQDADNDYDIDDGVYFDKEDLVGPRGADMTALEVRQMVRDALDDGSFKTPPEVRKKCVRVHYDAGYHVDLPIYRRVVMTDANGNEVIVNELAAADWVRSDAREVTAWFDAQNKGQSPDTTNGRQLRRVVRQIKKFARSRASWKTPILSGFGITKLVTECFYKNADREDKSLYYTMKAIRDRLNLNLVVKHPVTPNETITKGTDDSRARFLRDKLSDAIEWLDPLFASDCTKMEALKCWDKVFATSYFSNQLDEAAEETAVKRGSPVLTSGLLRDGGSAPAVKAAVRKEGGGRYA